MNYNRINKRKLDIMRKKRPNSIYSLQVKHNLSQMYNKPDINKILQNQSTQNRPTIIHPTRTFPTDDGERGQLHSQVCDTPRVTHHSSLARLEGTVDFNTIEASPMVRIDAKFSLLLIFYIIIIVYIFIQLPSTTTFLLRPYY